MRLEDKVAIITGAGQGIGEAYARRFAKEGARVVVADVNAEKGAAVARDIGQVFERVDVSSEDDTKRLCRAVAERFGRIDVLINNAAIFFGIDNQNTSYAYLRKIFDVNYFGAWLMCRAVFPHMRDGGGGSIINQSSGAAYVHPEYPIEGELPSFHYSVAKAALNAMTHYLAGSVGRGSSGRSRCPMVASRAVACSESIATRRTVVARRSLPVCSTGWVRSRRRQSRSPARRCSKPATRISRRSRRKAARCSVRVRSSLTG